tara:strand:- start:536 stop:739 length:204 start_codon:yes stop_codon:yes gene_type:complete
VTNFKDCNEGGMVLVEYEDDQVKWEKLEDVRLLAHTTRASEELYEKVFRRKEERAKEWKLGDAACTS